jgi:hypothetical protein
MTIPTGWDAGLCQDYHRGLALWFASRLDARNTLRRWFGEQRKTMNEQLITRLDLMQPVVMTPTLHNFPNSMMAQSDHPGHVLVRLGGSTHGMDTLTAIRLLRDLRNAVEQSAGWPPA